MTNSTNTEEEFELFQKKIIDMMTNITDEEELIPTSLANNLKNIQPSPRQSVISGETIQIPQRNTSGGHSSKSQSKGELSNDSLSEGFITCNFNHIKKICYSHAQLRNELNLLKREILSMTSEMAFGMNSLVNIISKFESF